LPIKRPSRKSADTFVRYLGNKDDLMEVTELRPFVFRVHMKGHVHVASLVEIYTVGVSDVEEIRSEDRDADSLVVTSNWHSYTQEAKDHARADSIGLFTFREFMKAVHMTGNEFLAHREP